MTRSNALFAAAFVAGLLASTSGFTKNVNNAVITGLDSGGVQGSNLGCLYIFYTDVDGPGKVKMPYNVVNPNTAQAAALMILGKTSPVSFNTGPVNPVICDREDFKDAPTLAHPGWGETGNNH